MRHGFIMEELNDELGIDTGTLKDIEDIINAFDIDYLEIVCNNGLQEPSALQEAVKNGKSYVDVLKERTLKHIKLKLREEYDLDGSGAKLEFENGRLFVSYAGEEIDCLEDVAVIASKRDDGC